MEHCNESTFWTIKATEKRSETESFIDWHCRNLPGQIIHCNRLYSTHPTWFEIPVILLLFDSNTNESMKQGGAWRNTMCHLFSWAFVLPVFQPRAHWCECYTNEATKQVRTRRAITCQPYTFYSAMLTGETEELIYTAEADPMFNQ